MSIRTERVAGVIRETITEVLALGGVKDPRVQAGGLITVTHVRVAADLGVAWVFVTTVGGAGVEPTVVGLRAAAKYLRGEVGKRLHSRRLPELRFEADVAAEREARVEAAFREIEADRAAERRVGAGGGSADASGVDSVDRQAGEPPVVTEPADDGDEDEDHDGLEAAAPEGGAPDAPAPDDPADVPGDAVPEETAFEDTERVEVPYPASIDIRPGGAAK